jgi:hypothetical protein
VSTERRDDFIAKAKEAELQAANASDEAMKAAWGRIAAAYYVLARHHDVPISRDFTR